MVCWSHLEISSLTWLFPRFHPHRSLTEIHFLAGLIPTKETNWPQTRDYVCMHDFFYSAIKPLIQDFKKLSGHHPSHFQFPQQRFTFQHRTHRTFIFFFTNITICSVLYNENTTECISLTCRIWMSYSNINRPQHILIYKIMEAKCIEMYFTTLLIILPIKKVKYHIYLE